MPAGATVGELDLSYEAALEATTVTLEIDGTEVTIARALTGAVPLTASDISLVTVGA